MNNDHVKLYQFIQSYQDRLDEESIKNMLEYIEFNEFENAFNILIDRLDVHEVKLSHSEWETLVDFAEYFDYSHASYIHLKRLIVMKK